MTKQEQKDKTEKEKYLALFADMDEKKAKKYIKENIYKVKLSKGLIAAYVNTYSKDDSAWISEAYVTKPRYKRSAQVGIDGKIVYSGKQSKKGKALPRTEKVYTGETYKAYDMSILRKLFIDKYKIEFKPTNFEAKQKRTEPVYDVFEGLI
jgi:hypothetical protein